MKNKRSSIRLIVILLLATLVLAGCGSPGPHWWVVTASSDNTARVWDGITGKLIARLDGHSGPIISAAFSPDSKWIVTASTDKTARIWDAATGKTLQILSGHAAAVLSAEFSSDGKWVLTRGGDFTARVWDASSGKQVIVLGTEQVAENTQVNATAFNPDNKFVLTASVNEGAVRVWDVASGQKIAELQPLPAGSTWFTNASYSPNGQWVATSSGLTGFPNQDFTPRIWEPATGKVIAELTANTTEIHSIIFSSDGKLVLTASDDKTAKLWEAATGKLIMELDGHTGPVYTAEFSPDGKSIVTASADGTARIWDASTGKSLAVLKQSSIVFSAHFSADGKYVVLASGVIASVWDAATGKLVAELDGHTKTVNSAVFSPVQR